MSYALERSDHGTDPDGADSPEHLGHRRACERPPARSAPTHHRPEREPRCNSDGRTPSVVNAVLIDRHSHTTYSRTEPEYKVQVWPPGVSPNRINQNQIPEQGLGARGGEGGRRTVRVLRERHDGVAGAVGVVCPGRKPPFWAGKHPARPCKSATQNPIFYGKREGLVALVAAPGGPGQPLITYSPTMLSA